ncbi:amidohydrolase [Pseudoalteromonas sp.]|uniref:amidohydrolase family protein n=1 Tax=Pseudoalteromonas sp. TaxID=53249 RepID=UPI0035662D9F
MATQHSNAIFDPHLHLFYLDEGDYFWLKNALPPWPQLAMLQKDFSVKDLILNSDYTLSNFVHIEAGFNNQQPEKEIAFLESAIGKLHKAIGYAQIDLAPSSFEEQIKTLQKFSSFVGIRDITEDNDAIRLHADNVNHNFALLAKNKLIFEAQFEISELQHTKRLCELAKANPNLNIVLNHAGLVTPQNYENWLTAIVLLAKIPNIYIKYSGFEMQQMTLSNTFRRQIFKEITENFALERVMFASNFPICLMTSSYLSLWQHYKQLCANEAIWQKLSYDNASQLYKF